MKNKKIHLSVELFFILFIFIGTFFSLNVSASKENFDIRKFNQNTDKVTEKKYFQKLEEWSSEKKISVHQEIKVSDYYTEENRINTQITYKEPFSIELHKAESIEVKFNVAEKGLYRIQFDYYDLSDEILPAEAALRVNDKVQYYEANQIMFLSSYTPISNDFTTDRYGNEIANKFQKNPVWLSSGFKDGSRLRNDDLLFQLAAGENELKITLNSGQLLFGNFYLVEQENYRTYEEYLDQYSHAKYVDTLIQHEVEYISEKNDLSIRIYSESEPSSTRYSNKKKLMNAVAGENFSRGNQKAGWTIEAEEAGLYKISFRAIQYGLVDLPVHRDIFVNGEIPFKEFKDYQFKYSKKYSNVTLSNPELEPFFVYLKKGTNQIELRSSVTSYLPIIDNLDRIMKEMRNTAMEIKRITSGKEDQYRDWKLTEYMPDLVNDLNRWKSEISELMIYGNSFSNKEKGSSEFNNIERSIKKFNQILKNPDQLPNKMKLFTEGTTSIAQLLGDLMIKLSSTPLGLEKMYLHGENKLPKANANVFVKFGNSVSKFFLSFFSNEYSSGAVKKDELDVWVRRPRQFIELMQKMIDEDFTPKTGIKIKLSVMPDQNKLILANAANETPDVAMGVDNWIPYDLALRGISVDFRDYEGYEELIKNHAKGSFIPYAFEDGMYGIPETQDFWVSFYRTDILNNLKIDYQAISTWNDVKQSLPILQNYGMNFYEPLAGFVGLKPFVATLPFIYQFGGNLYAEDGLSCVINEEKNIEALKFMTDLFTIYSMTEQVPSFYNDFRYGKLPMGIANGGTYTQLLVAAPEIKGQWEIGLHPGMYSADQDQILRYAPVGSQGIMMFESSQRKQDGFDFIKWWMSTEVQREFIYTLTSMFGAEYLWFSANQEAFKALPLPEKHKEVILEQWKWSMEASRIPGAYIVEREISDGFSKILYNNKNPRTVLDQANITANREIMRKMEEFGYMKNGVKVKDYPVPNLYNIDSYLKGRDR